jgi:hypothetical protein
MMIRDERTTALYLLRLSRQYIAKANEQGAYAGCTLSGDTMLRRLDAGIDALAGSPELQAPVVERMEY